MGDRNVNQTVSETCFLRKIVTIQQTAHLALIFLLIVSLMDRNAKTFSLFSIHFTFQLFQNVLLM